MDPRTFERWPALPRAPWRETRDTLHMWTQIVGKIRLALAPPMNQWWQVPLYVDARGLTTSPIPRDGGVFEIAFDLVEHDLVIRTSDGELKAMPLIPRSVADFHRELFAVLHALDIEARIDPRPVEVERRVPFDRDEELRSYDREWVGRFFQVLVHVDTALRAFRSRFTGKASPVQFYWGTFDLALALFSGRPATPPAGDRITRVAYSAEQFECGFWPGDERSPEAGCFAFLYPQPPGVEGAAVEPPGAWWDPERRYFLLPWEVARQSADPAAALDAFFRGAYEATTALAGWDRASLERHVEVIP